MNRLVSFVFGAWIVVCAAAQAQTVGEPSFEQVERGRYLAVLGDCTACHTLPGGKPFAGGVALETPFGALIAPNITPDMATGIGAWSEADFLRTMSEGIGRNGVHLYPAMPYPAYTKVTPGDVSAIWAYLRTLEPVGNEVDANQLRFPFNIRRLDTSAWNLINFRRGVYQPDPTKSELWNRGAYLVEGLGHCGTCHTPKNVTGGDRSGMDLQGALLQDWYAPDLTTNVRKGIGGWSIEEIVRYLKTGANSYDIASGPMADAVEHSTSHMTDADLLAIATYLKEGDARNEAPVTAVVAGDRRMVAGKEIYDDRCGACHITSGAGIPTLFPRLSNAPLVQADDPTSLIRVVLMGSRAGTTAAAPTGPAMPSFAWNLSDEDVANVLTYIRNAWGNAAQPVQPGDVKGLRDRLQREAAGG